MLHNLILPLITLTTGILSLYIDPKRDKGKAWMIVFVLMLSAAATGMAGLLDDRDKDHEKTIQQMQNDILQADLKWQKKMFVLVAQRWGIADPDTAVSDQATIQKSIDADEARSQILKRIRETETRTSGNIPLIEYFPKDVDDAIVTAALKDSGFEFRKGNSATVLPTNAIWVGDSVTLDDTKFVALTLIRAGVKLREIRRFQSPTTANSRKIQIGANKAWVDVPVLTVGNVLNMAEPPARGETPF